MNHLRLLYVSLLLSFLVTGCHQQHEIALVPPQAQPPIISTLPAMPSLMLSPVELAKSKPVPQVVVAPPPAPPKPTVRVHHRRSKRKSETGASSTDNSSTTTASGENISRGAMPPGGTGASPIGQLSAEDADVNPKQAEQTKHLIDSTQKRLKHISASQQAKHKAAIAEINAFLTQAKQALNSKDLVGAQTLANKAKILLDELLK